MVDYTDINTFASSRSAEPTASTVMSGDSRSDTTIIATVVENDNFIEMGMKEQ